MVNLKVLFLNNTYIFFSSYSLTYILISVSIFIAETCILSVSYTHLDVYKRQVNDRTYINWTSDIKLDHYIKLLYFVTIINIIHSFIFFSQHIYHELPIVVPIYI